MVFESIVADVLNKYLGEYVKNLDRSQLNIGIWGGNIVLKNLNIRESALEDFDLPLSIVFGRIDKLTIKVPWKSIYTSPTSVLIDGLYLLVMPKSTVKYDEEKEEKSSLEYKQRELDRIEKVKQQEMEKDKEKSQQDDTFKEKLVMQVIKNLQIVIHNVHIRYEDNYTYPQRPFSFGITLSNLAFQTTDEDWIPAVMGQEISTYHKLANLEFFSFYWSCESHLYYAFQPDDVKERMILDIAAVHNSPKNIQYVLQPVTAQAKMVINSKPELGPEPFSQPKITLSLEIEQILLSIKDAQYADITRLITTIEMMKISSMYRKYRPPVPVSGNAKLWWDFAITAILEEDVKRRKRNWSWDHMHNHRVMFRNYKESYKVKLTTKKLSPFIVTSLEHCERHLDIFNITVARRQAELEVEIHNRQKRNDDQNNWSSWLGSWFSKPKREESKSIAQQFEEVMSPGEKAKLYEAIGYQDNAKPREYPETFVQHHMTFLLKDFILIVNKSDGSKKVIEAVIDSLGICLSQRPSAQAIKVELKVQRMEVNGNQGSKMLHPFLPVTLDPMISILYETNPHGRSVDQVLHVKSHPMEFIYNADTINGLVDCFKPPGEVKLETLYEAAMLKIEDIKELSATGLKHAIQQRKSLDMIINIMPSYIVIPENGKLTANAHQLIVNLGQFSCVSATLSPEDFEALKSKKQFDEITDLAYDKFTLTISNIGILLARPGESWTEMLKVSDSEIHILRPTTVELKLEKAIIQEDYRIPKIRFSFELPQIHFSFSEAKLTELLRLVLSIPTRSEPAEVQSPLNPPAGRGLHSSFDNSTQALKVVNQLSKKEKEEVLAKSFEDELDSIQKQMVELDAKFEISKVGFELYKLTDKKIKVLEGSFSRLGTKAVVRTLDTQVKFFLGEILIQNHEFMDPEQNGALKLISSPPFDESSDLITVNITIVKGEGPHIKNLYNNVLTSIRLHFTELFIVMHLEAMLSLMAFANKLLPPKPPPKRQVQPTQHRSSLTPLSRRRRRTSLSSMLEASGHSHAKRATPKNLEDLVTTLKVDIKLEAFKATICQEKCHISKLAIEGISAKVAMNAEETRVRLALQDIIVSNMLSDTLYTTILSTEAGQILNLDVQIFNHVAAQPSIPQEDIKIQLELGETRVVYLNSFIKSLVNFGDFFQVAKSKMAEASMAAAEAAKFGMEQAYEKATRIGLQISLKAPLIVVPQNSHSNYALVLDLGTLWLHNKFQSLPASTARSSTKNAPLLNTIFDNMTFELKDVMLLCCLVDPHGNQFITSQSKLIEPISFDLNVTRNLSIKWHKDVPEMAVSGKLHAVKMALSEEDLAITMKMLSENMKENPCNTPPPPQPKKVLTVEKPQPKKSLAVISENLTENYFTGSVYEFISLHFMMESFSLVLYTGKSSLDEKERNPENSLAALELSTVKIIASLKSDNCLSAQVLFKDLTLDDTRPFRQNGIRRLMQRNSSNEGGKNNVMGIVYEKNAAGDTTLNVTVSSFAMIVYLKYFMRISEFFTQSLPKAPPEEPPKSIHIHHKQEAKGQILPPPITTQTVTFVMEKPDLVLIEDLDDINSSSLILNSKVFVRLIITMEEQNISVSIADLELFTSCFNPQRRASTSNKILNPCNFVLHGSIKKEESRLDLQLGEVSIHVTPSTVNFLMNIMQGLTSEPKLSLSEAPPIEEDYLDIWEHKKIDSYGFWFIKAVKPQLAIEATESLFFDSDSSSSDESSHHAFEQLLVHLDTLIITVESDFGKRTVPMLLLESSLASEVNNWSSQLKVLGQINLEMAYFNEKIGIWEPLLEPIENAAGNFEPWSLFFELTKNALSDGPDEIDELEEFKTPTLKIELKSKEYLNLTITKTALDLLTDLNKSFQAALDSDETDKCPVQQGPFLVENHMGMNLVIQANNKFEAVSQTGTAVFDTLILEPYTSIHLLPVIPLLTSSKTMHSLLRKQEVTDNLFFNIQIPLKQCPSCIRKIELTQASTRYFQLQQRTYPGDQWGFVVDISTSSGYKIITFRSPVQVKNNFSNMGIDVYYMLHTGNELVKCGTVEPLKTLHLPLHAVYTPSQEIFFGPSNNKYKVGSQAIIWKDVDQVNLNLNRSVITCKHSGNEAYNFQIKVNKEIEHYLYEETGKQTLVSIGYQIVLSPTVIFRNLLPIPVYIKTEGLEKEVAIEEGHSKELWACQVGSTKLQIKLLNYLGKQWTIRKTIEDPIHEITSWTFTSDIDGQTMDLGMAADGKKNSLEMNLYCPFWMVNSTGLSLTYKQGSERESVIHHPPKLSYPVLFSYKGKDFFTKKKVVFKVMDSEWSNKFSMDVVGSSGSVIVKENSGKAYCVSVNIKLGNSNALTKIITFSPFYILVNNSNKPVKCRENYESSHWIEIKPKDCIPFWPIHNEHSPELQACYADNPEDLTAPFSYKESHSTLLKLFSTRGGIFVECIFAEDTSIVIKFEDYHPGTATVLMVNHTSNQTIFYNQKGEGKVYKLHPGYCQLYTWDKPTRSARTLIWHCTGSSSEFPNNLLMDGIGEVNLKNDENIYWVSFLDHTQRVLLFTEDVALATVAQQPGELEKPEQEIVISFQGMGISLVNNNTQLELLYFVITGSGIVWESKTDKLKAKRSKHFGLEEAHKLETHYQRYLMERRVNPNVKSSIRIGSDFEVDFAKMEMLRPSHKFLNRNYKPGLWFMLKRSPHHLQLHCKINRLQIDNQLLDSTFPVLLAPTPLNKTVAANHEPKPFVEVSIMIRQAQHSSMMQFKYFKLLIQEFHIKIAMGFIYTLLEFFSKEDNLTIDYPQMMLKDQEVIKQDLKTLVEAYTVETKKSFFDYIHLSPIKVHISFSIADPYEEKNQQNIHSQFFNLILQSLGVTLTEVQDIVLKLNYFERESQFLSSQQVIKKVVSHYSNQAIKQIYMLIFGLDVIGNPVGLIMGLTTGVGDFFYEPFQGLIQGPEEFAEGLALGIRSLFGHAVGGAAGSVSRITGTLGKGLAALTLDKEYQRKRRERLNTRPHDLSHNLAQSSRGLVMGVFEGLTGVITKPIEGAQEEGVEGFFKGMGKGLIGVVARPTTGAFDFAATSFDAVKRATEMTDEARRSRPPRYIKPDKIIRPYRRMEADGNQIFHQIEKGKFVKTDRYFYHERVAAEKSYLFITNNRVMYVSKGDVFGQWNAEWHYTFDELVAPIQFEENSLKIMLKAKKKGGFFFGGRDNGKIVHFRKASQCKMVLEKLEEAFKKNLSSP